MIKKTKNVAKALLVLWHKAKNIRVGISMLNYQGGGGNNIFDFPSLFFHVDDQ